MSLCVELKELPHQREIRSRRRAAHAALSEFVARVAPNCTQERIQHPFLPLSGDIFVQSPDEVSVYLSHPDLAATQYLTAERASHADPNLGSPLELTLTLTTWHKNIRAGVSCNVADLAEVLAIAPAEAARHVPALF